MVYVNADNISAIASESKRIRVLIFILCLFYIYLVSFLYLFSVFIFENYTNKIKKIVKYLTFVLCQPIKRRLEIQVSVIKKRHSGNLSNFN